MGRVCLTANDALEKISRFHSRRRRSNVLYANFFTWRPGMRQELVGGGGGCHNDKTIAAIEAFNNNNSKLKTHPFCNVEAAASFVGVKCCCSGSYEDIYIGKRSKRGSCFSNFKWTNQVWQFVAATNAKSAAAALPMAISDV